MLGAVLSKVETALEVEKSEGSLEGLSASEVGRTSTEAIFIIQQGKARTEMCTHCSGRFHHRHRKGFSRRGFAGQIGAQQVAMEQ